MYRFTKYLSDVWVIRTEDGRFASARIQLTTDGYMIESLAFRTDTERFLDEHLLTGAVFPRLRDIRAALESIPPLPTMDIVTNKESALRKVNDHAWVDKMYGTIIRQADGRYIARNQNGVLIKPGNGVLIKLGGDTEDDAFSTLAEARNALNPVWTSLH